MRSFVLGTAIAWAVASASYAADLPLKAPPKIETAYGTGWTGFYLGGQVGYGWASSTQTNVEGTGAFLAGTVQNAVTPSGPLGGVYGGYNYQMSQWLVGIDADFSWASLTGGNGTDSSNTGIAGGRTSVATQRVKSLGTVTGRFGYIFYNNWLWFGKAGWAWSSWNGGSTVTRNDTGVVTTTGTNSTNRSGWTVGTGAEWAFAPHWSAKFEYDYVKFNTVNYNTTDTTPAGVVTTPARSATSFMNVMKVGLAYRF